MQRYRSGHNGADSKSVWEQSHEGSNPSRCAKKEKYRREAVLFLFLQGIRTREGPGERKTFRGTVLEKCIEIKKLLIASINTAKKG